jgi:HEAT repeat protein
MVQGENTRLSFYAMRALERRTAGAVPAIEEDIRDRGFSEMSPSLAARYLRLLSTTGDPKHIPTITSALSDPRNYLRGEAMRALSNFKTDAAHRAMIRGLQDPWEDVRFEAASALGAHKVKAAVPALIQMVRKQDTKMLPAIRALGEIGDTRALKVLYQRLEHERSTVRQYTCTAIGDIGEPESLSHLLKAINDKDELVAFYAKRAMKRID